MTASQFEEIWASEYNLSPPISYLLKRIYPERWFRVYSLPDSKRFPENDVDWDILLDRQNALISDLLGDNSDILIVTGDYGISSNDNHERTFSPVESISHLSFTELQPILLETLNDEKAPDEYQPGDFYRPFFSQVSWQHSTWNGLLTEIAKDELRALFISVANRVIVAPYDGGVDIILKDEPTRNMYKAKYKKWLSGRKDGL